MKVEDYDEIGPWSKVKLDIVKRYATKYSIIISAQKNPLLYHCYIDAFAGPGVHIAKDTKEMILGSPTNALLIEPPFKDIFLINIDHKRTASLREIVGPRENVTILEGDCNELLPQNVYPRVQWRDYKRGLCILDPYKIENLHWKVIKLAGEMGTLDVFINFPIMDINRSILRRDQHNVSDADNKRMEMFWGDNSWREIAFKHQKSLFSEEDSKIKVTNNELAEAYRMRLQEIAGFKIVPRPLAMKNSKNAVIYYLFFASPKGAALDIVNWIFDTYRAGGTTHVP